MSGRKIAIAGGSLVTAVFLLAVALQDDRTRPIPPDAPTPPRSPDPGRRALLIGVTRYDHFRDYWLDGPGNDAAHFRRILTSEDGGFPEENVTCLTELEGRASHRPTRQNIEREFRLLAERAREGDQVFILVAGHGCRLPESLPAAPEHRQADGVNELFLPADAAPAVGTSPRVSNAVLDVEFRAWLTEITKKGAFVCVVFDCCHSGDMSRAPENVREIPAALLVPAGVFAAGRLGPSAERPRAFHPSEDAERLVVFYACRATERTREAEFPGEHGPEVCGIFSRTLGEVLTAALRESVRPTYRELHGRILERYDAKGWVNATPTVEGGSRDRRVIGEVASVPAQFRLTETGGRHRVNAGFLHGLTPGSVLVAYDPTNPDLRAKILGRVRVVTTTPLDSVVEQCEGPFERLPQSAPCDIERLEIAFAPVRVALARETGDDRTADAVRTAVEKVAEKYPGLVTGRPDPKAADWIIRRDGGRWSLTDALGNRPDAPLSPPTDPAFGDVLAGALLRIHRAESLVALGTRLETGLLGRKSTVDFDISFYRMRPGRPEERCMTNGHDLTMYPEDRFKIVIHNSSKTETVDIALLIVWPNSEIRSFYPGQGRNGKEIVPGGSLEQESLPYTNDPPFGPEHLVAVAVPASSRVDLSALSQPTFQLRGSGIDALSQLLNRTRGGVESRGVSHRAAAHCAVRVLSWRTAPAVVSP